jgi:hypothetical protein
VIACNCMQVAQDALNACCSAQARHHNCHNWGVGWWQKHACTVAVVGVNDQGISCCSLDAHDVVAWGTFVPRALDIHYNVCERTTDSSLHTYSPLVLVHLHACRWCKCVCDMTMRGPCRGSTGQLHQRITHHDVTHGCSICRAHGA